MTAGEAVRRRLWAYRDSAGDPDAESASLLVGILLEEGDSTELRWLVAEVGETRLAEWLGRRGGRKLSRRSRRFWELALDRPAGGRVAIAPALWPLA